MHDGGNILGGISTLCPPLVVSDIKSMKYSAGLKSIGQGKPAVAKYAGLCN